MSLSIAQLDALRQVRQTEVRYVCSPFGLHEPYFTVKGKKLPYTRTFISLINSGIVKYEKTFYGVTRLVVVEKERFIF